MPTNSENNSQDVADDTEKESKLTDTVEMIAEESQYCEGVEFDVQLFYVSLQRQQIGTKKI